jgi:hypothetical protein
VNAKLRVAFKRGLSVTARAPASRPSPAGALRAALTRSLERSVDVGPRVVASQHAGEDLHGCIPIQGLARAGVQAVGDGVEFILGVDRQVGALGQVTFELTGHRRWDARPGLAKMYRVPPDRAWWPAVGAPVERGVRPHRAVAHVLAPQGHVLPLQELHNWCSGADQAQRIATRLHA